ncbi:MAG: DNA-directed RNA polymerase subunit delta [bacterium]|jgi:DNA-directed RNA polymerase subunit delta
MNRTEKPPVRPRLQRADIAYAILKERREPLHYKQLAEQIFQAGDAGPEEGRQRLIASILTDINLDNRFFHYGGGLWGLREWSPKQKPQRVPLLAPLHKRQREDPDERDDEDGDELEQGFIINDFDFAGNEEEDYDE